MRFLYFLLGFLTASLIAAYFIFILFSDNTRLRDHNSELFSKNNELQLKYDECNNHALKLF